MHIRTMLASDIPDVAQAHRAAWQVAYRGILSDPLLDGLSQVEFERNWQGILQRPNRTTLVIEHKGRVIGYVAFGPDPGPSQDPAWGEIIGLYVHPDHWRKGASGQLLAEAMAQLGQRGFTRAIVWTVRDHACARRFYQEHGFCLDGYSREAECCGVKFLEVRLSKEIEPRQASALIVARSGPFRESLAVLMRAIPRMGRIDQAEDISSALADPRAAPPDLILCDLESVQDETVETLRRVKIHWPQSRCVVLVQGEDRGQEARAAGADVVLTKGVLAARLLEAIEGLIS